MTDDLVKQLPEYHNLTVESAAIFKVIEARLAASSKDKTDRIEKLEAELHSCFHRIEELQAALLWYAEHCQKGGDDIEGPYGDYGQRAREALEGKND